MAEAHSAVAFSFSVTPDGFDVNLNHEAFKAVWQSGVRSWKKRYARMRVRLSHHTGSCGNEYNWDKVCFTCQTWLSYEYGRVVSDHGRSDMLACG